MITYLFKCQFKDGTCLEQTEEDVSQTTPGKNAFFDVLERIDDVVAFEIINDFDYHSLKVDLQDGHFESNGIAFNAFPFDYPGRLDQPFRLVYFLRHTHTMGQYGEDHTVEYHIGWEILINGKNYRQTISVF